MDKTMYLTSGEVAAILGVTRATVVQWINTGKLASVKTAGKHNRIKKEELRGLLPEVFDARGLGVPVREYCWEFFSKGKELPHGCASCIVYRTRAAYCHRLANEVGHKMIHCSTTCEKCKFGKLAMSRKKRPENAR